MMSFCIFWFFSYTENMHNTLLIDTILYALDADVSIETKEQFQVLRNTILAKTWESTSPSHIEFIERYNELVKSWQIHDSHRIRKVLRKRAVRSLSGVSVISLLTKFWGCPGKCIYCPTYEWLPKSYISDEPAVQRAEMNQFDPYLQIQNRLSSLEITGNAISKCDVRIIGWTWSVYPREYQEDFIKNIYDAHSAFNSSQYTVHSTRTEQWNPFSKNQEPRTKNQERSATLEEAKKKNETAISRVIGMAIETRPDWIDEEEIVRLRRYGITRVEIGYQTTDDEINILNKRGHGNRESIHATKLLKDAGFKVVAHMMPWLVGSTPDIDKVSMQEIWDNQAYRPDEIKIYPLVVTPNSELTDIWRRGEFEPYDDTTLIPLMAEIQSMIPEYVRLLRMYRDIPAHEILAGSKIANLRQVTEVAMRARWFIRHDISAREIRAKGNDPHTAVMRELFYEASDGHEYFLQMIDPTDRTIFALLRLRIPSQYFSGEKHFIDVLNSAAIVRELHVFGDQIPVWEVGNTSWQHMGFGKRLMERAEEIVREKYSGIEKVAVIAWVWVRGYYEKRWYLVEQEYMVKYLK
jgi:elongator complex protein 3